MIDKVKWWILRTFKATGKPVSNLKVASGIIESHYKFGSVNQGAVINETGLYTDFLPDNKDIQFSSKMDTMNCTCFGLTHADEIMDRVIFGNKSDYSPRYLGTMAGTTSQGNSMTKVLDTCRKISGMVNDSDWSFTPDMTWEQYYSSIPKTIIAKGQEWKNQYNLVYSVVSKNKNAIREALKHSPLYVSGYAWCQSGGLYRSWGTANHCFCVIGIDTDGNYLAYDSYSPFVKKLAPDYIFGAVFSLSLTKNVQYNLNEIKKLIDRGLQYVLLVNPFKDYPAGAYKLNPDGITQEDVVKEINDEGVKSFEKQGKLVGINADNFKKLIV